LLLSAGRTKQRQSKEAAPRSTLPWVLVVPLTAFPPHQPELTPSLPFRFPKASSRSRLCSSWSAFDHFWVHASRCATSAIKGGTHQVGSAEHRRRHFLKRAVELIGRNGFASVHFRRTTQLWFVALRVRHSDSPFDDAILSLVIKPALFRSVA